MKSYGILKQTQIFGDLDFHLENIRLKGFSIAKNFIDENYCDHLCLLLEKQYENNLLKWPENILEKINEKDIVRMPFIQNKDFFDLFMNPFVLKLGDRLIGNAFHLHLQNGIINRPLFQHHQSSWHRDLPYQNWVISSPLAFNAFYCLTDFKNDNGATFFLPFSHRTGEFPSERYVEENKLQIIAPKGSVIFFDSMVFHQAGFNRSSQTRYGINNMFVVPILKQQIDIPRLPYSFELSDNERKILGFNFEVPEDVDSFLGKRLKKKENEKG